MDAPALSAPTDAVAEVPADKLPARFKAGSLCYTGRGLLMLLVWLLWGDFWFNLMETSLPSLVPLKLKALEAPNWAIALIMTAMPNALNATVCPAVSFWSDRFRSRWGRRIPFIVLTAPFLCLFLAMVGLSPWVSDWMKGRGWIENPAVASIILIGIFCTGFQFFNMFVGSVYYYLFNDVVPTEYLGRFLAAFRCVGILAGAAFSYFIFPHAETHFSIILVAASVFYGLGIAMMCAGVKEGTYPPPPPRVQGGAVWAGIKTFVVECYATHRFYWLFYLAVSFWAAANTGAVFQIFFARSLGLTLTQLGVFGSFSLIISAALLLPCGLLSDRLHPLRTLLFAASAQSIISLFPLVFLFWSVSPEWVYTVWIITAGVSIPFTSLFIASELPTFMRMLPKDRYGQFSASTALLRSLVCLVVGLLAGLLIDVLVGAGGRADTAYRYLPIWMSFFQGLSSLCLFLLYREWKKLGGAANFVPPPVRTIN